jgi:putative peptidoglycan lipid II flippase
MSLMIKGFRQIASLTAVSRVFGLVRDITYGHFFGASALFDAWVIAFRIPNLSRRLFGEGAASASLIPIYSETLHKDPAEAGRLANTVVTVLFVLLGTLVLAGEAAIWIYYRLFAVNSETRLILSLTSVMLPYMLFVCTVAILAGILNVHRHFASPAAAPIVLNIFIIGSILLTGIVLNVPPRQQLFYIAVAVIIAGLVQIAMQLPPLGRAGVLIRPAWQIHSEAFRKMIILMGPMVLGLTVTQINTLADDLIAWWLSGSDEKGWFFTFLGRQIAYPLQRSSVSHLYYAQRLYQLPLGVFGISLATAVFPVMSSYSARKDFKGLAKTVATALRTALFIALPATIGLIIIARPLISLFFEHGKFTRQDTQMTAFTLLFYAMGLSGYFGQQILTRAFYSMQHSKLPMRSAVIAVFANVVLNLVLVWPLGRGGLACSTALCSYLQVAVLLTALRRQLGGCILEGFAASFTKTAAATACMWAAGYIALWLSRHLHDAFRLALVVGVSVLVYLLAAKLLRIEMLSSFFGGKKT